MVGCGRQSGEAVSPVSQVTMPWGAAASGNAQALLPADRIPQGMLEIFLLGGMSPWETFYVVPEHGDPKKGGDYANQQWWNFYNTSQRISVPDFFKKCGGESRPIIEPWKADAAGMTVNLGPFIYPLRDRPDILSRMRIWVMAHNSEPHEVGIPLGITGHLQGNPRLAALGAHLQRFHQDRDTTGRVAPYSYAISLSSLHASNNGTAAWAVGRHRSSARPLTIRLGPNIQLPDQLPRSNVDGYRPQLDALVRHYMERLRGQFVNPDIDAFLRARGLDDFEQARYAMENHAALAQQLPKHLFKSKSVDICVPDPLRLQEQPVTDETNTGIELGRHLLTAANDPARYVQVLDSGVYPDEVGQGYDSHAFHVEQQGPNMVHVSRALTRIINEPGENDPNKLDLDKHMVLLNTEFGRTPYREHSLRNPDGNGTDHWPWGYVIVGFGGCIDADRAQVVGAIGENGRAKTGAFTPAEHRAAMLLAMGVWPFTEESFAVGDMQQKFKTELDAAMYLRESVLGYST